MPVLGTRVRRIAPLAALVAAGGCFATRADVRVVQSDIASLRTELLRNDAELRQALAQATATLKAANDSLEALSVRAVSTQGDVRGGTRAVQEQLLTVQQLLGQSQAQINRLRAEIERNAMQVPPPPIAGTITPPPASGIRDTTIVDSTVAPPQREPGPSELYTGALDQLSRGSFATARTLLQELLSKYPTSDHAPNAQFYIAQSYDREKNLDAADAAYAAVVSMFPDADRAPTALYKRAGIAKEKGNKVDAQRLAEEVRRRYPKSDEAELVPDFISSLK